MIKDGREVKRQVANKNDGLMREHFLLVNINIKSWLTVTSIKDKKIC